MATDKTVGGWTARVALLLFIARVSATMNDGEEGDAVSPTPLIVGLNASAAATLRDQTMVNASSSLSNTTLTEVQNDNDTYRLQLLYRQRKKQERLLLIQAQILHQLGMSRQPNITSSFSDDELVRFLQVYHWLRHIRHQGTISDFSEYVNNSSIEDQCDPYVEDC